jgi:AcrR family transcriptional regulator
MATRERAGEEIRARILEAALDEVAASGEGVTLQAVAARADVALRTLYNHFAGREALLTAAFLHHAAQTRAAVEAVTVPDAPPDQQLRDVLAAYHARYARMGERLSALLSLRGFPELDEQIHLIRAQRHQRMSEIVARAHAAGLLRLPVPTAIALAYALSGHATWQTLLEPADGDLTEATRLATEALGSALFHR